MKEPKGLINHILPKSFVDGPGNRAVVFMQGCNFNCLYCHNPYTINFCNACGQCVDVCPQNALRIIDKRVIWDQAKCIECDACIKACPNFSSPRAREYTPTQLWGELAGIHPFITGVSVSGGEPSLQVHFLAKFFRLIKRNSKLTTLIETNGYAGPQTYEALLPWLDMVSVDLKCIDPVLHKELTGKSIERVKDSITFFIQSNKLYAVHQVIVPGFTDTEGQMTQTAQFLSSLNPDIRLKLLRFRAHGVSGPAAGWESPSDEKMNALVEIAKASGLTHVERSL